jgi:hypothetical protein
MGEKVNDLIQVGLAARALETSMVEATALADSFIGLVEDTAMRLSRHALERLPGIIRK